MGFELENDLTEKQGSAQPEGNGGKTFTQEDVNRIVGERLAKDRAKNDADLIKREQELKQRELAMTAREILSAKGLPKDLAEILRYSDEESLNKSVDRIKELIEKETDSKGFKVLGDNRLPTGDHDFNDNSLEKAFRLNGKD